MSVGFPQWTVLVMSVVPSLAVWKKRERKTTESHFRSWLYQRTVCGFWAGCVFAHRYWPPESIRNISSTVSIRFVSLVGLQTQGASVYLQMIDTHLYCMYVCAKRKTERILHKVESTWRQCTCVVPVVRQGSVGSTCRDSCKTRPFAVFLLAAEMFYNRSENTKLDFFHLQIVQLARRASPATHVDVICGRELGHLPLRNLLLQPHQQLHDGHGVPHLQHRHIVYTHWWPPNPEAALALKQYDLWTQEDFSSWRYTFVCMQATYMRVPQDSLLGLVLHRFCRQHRRVRGCHYFVLHLKEVWLKTSRNLLLLHTKFLILRAWLLIIRWVEMLSSQPFSQT